MITDPPKTNKSGFSLVGFDRLYNMALSLASFLQTIIALICRTRTMKVLKSVARIMAGVTALLVLLIAAVPAYATEYTVGDSQGWTSGVDYGTWVSGKAFDVGDILSFQYGFLHSVDEVSESDYKACSASNSIQTFNDQNTKITLSKTGSRYFICGTAGHCTGGMKLAVTVAGSSTSPSTSPSTPSTPEGSTPSTSTPSTPSSGGQSSSTTPSSPSTTKINAATGGGFYAGNALLLGMLQVLGHLLMG